MDLKKFAEFVEGTESFFTPTLWNPELPSADLRYGILLVQISIDQVKLDTVHNFATKELQTVMLDLFLKSEFGKPYSLLEKAGMPILFIPSTKVLYGWSITPTSKSCFHEVWSQINEKVEGYQKSVKGCEVTGFPLQSTIPAKLQKSLSLTFKHWEKKSKKQTDEVISLF
jgi:hypothetical protein